MPMTVTFTELDLKPPRPLYFAGLDLGQARDYTALAIIERNKGATPDEPIFALRHLHRYDLGTSYPTIVADVVALLNREPLKSAEANLAIDKTGVGAAVSDLFKRKELPGDFKPIVITGGSQVTVEEGTWRVPKRDLVSVVLASLQTSRLKFAENVEHAATLRAELENFKVAINDNAHDVYAAREGAHDDLVLAVALALWTANRWRPDPPFIPSVSYKG